MPTTQNMQVEMVDSLSALVAGVDDGAKSVGETLFSSDFCSDEDEMPKKGLMGLQSVRLRGDVSLRDQENMRGSDGVEIAKGEAEVVLIDLRGGNLARDNATEDAVRFHREILLLEELRLFARLPGIVAGGEGGAAGDGRMASGPELHEGVRVGVDEGGLAELLERATGRLLGILDDAVDGLHTVDVCLVLHRAREAVGDGFYEEAKDGEGEHKDGKGSPVA